MASPKAKVLIMDDSPLVLEMVRAFLERAGFETRCRTNPVGIVSEVKRERPDVVVVDVSMPLVEGHEVVAQIRNCGADPSPAVLLYSARPEAELAEIARTSGADGFAQKSDDHATLIQGLREVLGNDPALPASSRPA